MDTTDRSNKKWVADLSGENGEKMQDQAIEDLYNILWKALYSHWLNKRSQFGDKPNEYIDSFAQDYASEGTIKLLNILSKFDESRADFLGFAFIVAKNLGGGELRKRHRENRFPTSKTNPEDDKDPDQIRLLSVDDTSESQIAVSEIMKIVEEGAKQLTEKQYQCFFEISLLPHNHNGRTRAQNATALLGISASAYYVQVNAARKKLKNHLRNHGIDSDYLDGLFG